MIMSSPWWCGIAILALLPWIGPWRGSNRVQNVLRSMLFLALGLALAQPHFVVDDTQVYHVLIADYSDSVSEDARQSVTMKVRRFVDNERAHLVVIGAPPAKSVIDGFEDATNIAASAGQGTSPLSAALSRAQSLIPRGSIGSITVASDALATRPDDDRAVSACLQRGLPIHWVDLPATERPPTPVQVQWTDTLRKGTTSKLNVQIVASRAGNTGTVSLNHDGKTLAKTTLTGAAGQTVVLEFEPQDAGFLEAEVIVSSSSGEQSLAVVLPVQKAHRLLYLGYLQTGGAEKLGRMIGSAFDITTVDLKDASAVSKALGQSDLVMLDDIPAELLPQETELQIVEAVQSGGLGLVMSGGRAAFGAGGWHDRPVESLLPVEFVQKEEKRDPSTSLVVVIDTSGSMSGVRVQLAKEVARLAIRRLLPHDKVGIVEFYGAKRWAAPLQPASNAIELQRALNRMDAGGGTVILPALEEAFYGLQNVDTRYKHVIVLTDGGVESGNFESLMRRMAAEGINVSTVLAGGGYHSEFLVNIANWGKGRFYNVPNRFNLPEILLKQPSTTKLPSYRPGTHLVRARGAAGWWGDVDISSVPPLAGYIESKARPGSQVLLETVTEMHPVLCTWRYGLGRVTTCGTEPVGAGTAPWKDWPEYSKAITRILQRSAADTRDPFRYEVEHDGGEVIIHAIRQQPRRTADCLPVARRVSTNVRQHSDQKDTEQFVHFIARSPDRFIARLPAPEFGKTLRFETSADTTPDRWQPLVATSPVVAEDKVDPAAALNMARLVAAAGGRKYDVSSEWTSAPTPPPAGYRFYSPSSWLFALALLLFLFEILWRRIPLRTTNGTQRVQHSTVSAALVVGLILCFSNAATAQQTTLNQKFSEQVNVLIESSIRDGVTSDSVNELFRSAVLIEGSVKPALDWLKESRGDLNKPRGQVIAELEVHLASRRGDLQQASDALTELLKNKDVAERRHDLRIWHAKLHDALGNIEEAKSIYEALTKEQLTDAEQQAVRLRLALMGLISGGPNRTGNDAKPLIELAENSKDISFRNRAANVLAVQNKHADAVKLFTVQGEGTQRFRSASRVTEWAIRAKNRDKAIEAGWEAVNSSELRRDRNYALAVLVESYRMKEQDKGLEKLVEKLKQKNDAGEKMSAEMRTVWINLLRELGKHDEAIGLFKSTSHDDSGFTVEMRRELLEMEGEAGHEDSMIESYRQLIQSEPNELTWRSGLTQILLEKGEEEKAEALWTNFLLETERGSLLLMSAQALGEFGLDDLSKKTIERMVRLQANHGQALLYWADLQTRRGNVDRAETTLNRILEMDDVSDEIRSELASAYERLGRQDKAIEVNEAIRAGRDTVAEDLEMRLAWLYSEIGDEDKALEQWLALWRKVTSIPRRRYVEDRLMTVASRLGTLADIAIDLEEKLADGTADDREAGLLVRIYSRVNDSVAATEISEEYMARSGRNEVEQLQEKGRIYQICNDYWNYEKVIERLIEVDPEGKTEYLRQLALSMLERGKAQEARAVLMTLRDADDGKDSIGGEFEAGVLSLVGMNAEAASAYRKGIATYPDRIESYLLLANLLKEMGQTDRAVGMFQYLAENADRDDMFTIAIDGLLNMEAPRQVMQWARRITLERLAGREDKNYLYQLLSDLSSEVNDKAGQILAMENSLAVSGTRRLSVLRECMELSSRIRGGVYYSSSSRGPTNKGNEPFFAFGRRLIGLGELMPPQVFLDLGQAFLDDGDTKSAERTFGMARSLADPRGYQREVAAIFEKGGKLTEALVRYDKLLRTSPSDVALMSRVAKLNEQETKDDVAFRFYQRGLDLLLSQTPLTTQEESKNTGNRYWSSNLDAYQTYSEQLLQGLLVTVPEEQVNSLLSNQLALIQQSLQELGEVADSGRIAVKLSDAPRIEKRLKALRKIYFAFDRIADLESVDQLLIDSFPGDKGLLVRFARERIQRGRYDSVRRMLDTSQPNEQQRNQLLTMLGDAADESETSRLSPQEMWQRFLPVWMNGDREAALKILRRVDQTKGRAPGTHPSYVIINGMAVMQNTGSASDVAAWMRLAISLDDEGLALQFARSRLQSGGQYGAMQIRQLFDTYKEILPAQTFGDLVRYATNLYKDDKVRLADYLWLVSQMSEYVGNDIPDDDKILELIQDGNLQISYYFPFSLAMDVFPKSIRAEAIAQTLDAVVPKYRPRELVRIAFTSEQVIDEATAQVLLESIESGIDPALQDNYLRYCTYYLPRNGTALKCPQNTDLAIRTLELLMTDKVRKREQTIPRMAEFIKAVVLHQSGRTDEALGIVLKSYDPTENITDYYLRYSRDWAYRELVPAATERFVELVDAEIKDGKPTVAQTDQRLALIKQAADEQRLRDVYRQAMKDHPQQTKYATAYERWEKGLKRNFAIIELFEQQLHDATQPDKAESNTETAKVQSKAVKAQTAAAAKTAKAKALAIKKRLAQLWVTVNHRPRALPFFSIADDQDQERFVKEQQARAAKSKSNSNENPATANTAPKSEQPSEEVKKPEKKYATSMAGVKSAIDDEDLPAAEATLRKIWRSFPPAVASPYRYISRKRFNDLTWPAVATTSRTSKAGTPPQKTAEEKRIAAENARQIARGGLGTFTPQVRAARKKPDNAWKVLADRPFAAKEMRRILRSESGTTIASVRNVSLGLLQATRNERGDEAVFAALVRKIHAGHISDEVLVHLFAMLEEDSGRINKDNEAVIDVLLDRLDLTNAARASQLANLCGKAGQRDRAFALYRHCALLTTTGAASLAGLIDQAKQTFEGDELMDLAESMFLLSKQGPAEASRILQLRLELLDPREAADRSRQLVEGHLSANTTVELQNVIQAVPVFARAGEYSIALNCLTLAIRQHGQPQQNLTNTYSYYTTSSSRNLLTVTRNNLIRMFPEQNDGYVDYDAWLKQAAKATGDVVGDAKPEIAVETLLTIALRQVQRNSPADAKQTLSYVTDDMLTVAGKHQLLAIDVLRLAGGHEQSLLLQSRMYEEKQLSHLRFGDLLRDTAKVEGQPAAAVLLETLVTQSMDEDLIAAAIDVSQGNKTFTERSTQLQAERKKADDEYNSRVEAARQRTKARRQWKSEDAASSATPKPRA
ncbi:MAG: VWA domain-containing protein [Fuerstiella sp.]